MRTQQKIINLYNDENISAVKHVISINSEDDLNQFWHFLSVSKNTTHELINAFITQFYNFALLHMTDENREFFEIILEESDKYFYFTIWNKNISLLFKSYIQKTSLKYIYHNNQICIKLNKSKLYKKVQYIIDKNKKREDNLIKSVSKSETKEYIQAYTFLDSDDLQELLKLSEDMQGLMDQAKKVGFNQYIFISMRSKFSLFCLILRYYDKIAPTAITLTIFSNLMNTNRDKFIKLSFDELGLIEGFIHNIDYWLQTLFVNGGANLYFMDNSLKADYQIISQIINPEDTNITQSDLDAIFDF